MEHVGMDLDAPRVVMTWEDGEEPWLNLAGGRLLTGGAPARPAGAAAEATISDVSYVSEGCSTDSQAETRISIAFTVNSATAVLAWGGHIARAIDWGILTVACRRPDQAA